MSIPFRLNKAYRHRVDDRKLLPPPHIQQPPPQELQQQPQQLQIMSDTSNSHPTKEPFSDPNPPKDGLRQSAAKMMALPLAAAGGVIAEVGTKMKELITGEHSKIETDHRHHAHHDQRMTSSSPSAASSSVSSSADKAGRDDPASRSQSASDAD
ncbi:hypothetical protein DFQ26_006187 [Actinomortierella ambigua]|nr:hypothetical protein DFQ26_006187 [Actinomortierella ambigua]